MQGKLSDLTRPSASKTSSANMEVMDNDASSTPEDNSPDKSKDTVAGEHGPMSAAILTAVSDMKTEFSTRFDGVLTAIESVRKDITDCAERVTEAETMILIAKHDINSLQTKVRVLENKKKDLELKLLDLELRSRCSNLRLVNLPEGAKGKDACASLESWLPDALELAHRASGGQGAHEHTTTPPLGRL